MQLTDGVLPPPTVGPQRVQGGQGLLPAPNMDGGMSDIASIVKQKQQATAPYLQQTQQNTQQVQNLAQSMGGDTAPQTPSLKKTPDAPQDNFKDAMQAFANPGAVLTLLGSFKTRHPMTTAMNAAAGMVNAYHAKDKEQIEQNRQKWLDAVAATKDQNQAELDQYKATLENKTFTRDQKAAQINALAAANKDQLGMASVASGNLDAFEKIVEARQSAAASMDRALVSAGFVGVRGQDGKMGFMPAGPSGDPKGLPNQFPDSLSFMRNPKDKDKELAKISLKDDQYMEKVQGDINAVQSMKDNAQQFMNAANEQGTGIKSGLESMTPGFMQPAKVQEMNKLNTEFAALKARAMSARATQMEFGKFGSATLSPSNKLETNQAIANAMTAYADRTMDYNQFLSNYKQANPNHNLEGAEDAWINYLQDVPLFAKDSSQFELNPMKVSAQDYFDMLNEGMAAGHSEAEVRKAIKAKFGG